MCPTLESVKQQRCRIFFPVFFSFSSSDHCGGILSDERAGGVALLLWRLP